MKSETAENLEGRVDVLINAVYNKNIKLKGIFKMRVKIYEGRIYSVVKEKDGNICVETVDGLYKNDAEFKKAMKANGEKFIGIANKEKVHNTYEISAEIVKEHGTLVTD